ncbi:MAG: hypothetical protein HWQ38_24030 [Nostoc sp. NMS7]|uniref:hypothetical protein n=1 Tax=Nostoc sp. NMS7 TaxID=2815391 RepID=UPI0025D894AD|nr:hypothetical protein [Nostoc sp. NMS7]MBN3949362.1 hypothetical protein [Nostoc sp. NMS7]
MLDFATATQNPAYRWEPNSRRYRVSEAGRNALRTSGKFLSKSATSLLTQLRIAQVTQDLHSLGNLLLDGKITLRAWQEQFAESLKILHTQQYLLGIGGQSQMEKTDYLVLARELKNQYKYLRNFAVDLTKGVMSPAQFQIRAAMYAKAAKVSYFRGEKQAAVRSGLDGAYRVLGESDYHCIQCPQYAAMGIVPIDEVVYPTQRCDCRIACLCRLVFTKLSDAIKPKVVEQPPTSDDAADEMVNALTYRQVKELVDDYKLDAKGNADELKQRFIGFLGSQNTKQLGNIKNYIQKVKERIK